jgi:hypothetical protein
MKMRGRGDAETRRRGDAETGRRGDGETGDGETRGHGDRSEGKWQCGPCLRFEPVSAGPRLLNTNN